MAVSELGVVVVVLDELGAVLELELGTVEFILSDVELLGVVVVELLGVAVLLDGVEVSVAAGVVL